MQDFDDYLDERTRGKATSGPHARRKITLSNYETPVQLLDQAPGFDIAHRTFTPEAEYEYPTTVSIDDGDETVRVHLFQDVRESTDEIFGDFGAAEDDKDDVVWTVVDLCDETVNLTVVGDWGKRREVPFETFADEYDPITVTVNTATGTREVPRYGY